MTEAEKRVKAISLYDNWCETDTEDTLEIYCYEKGRADAIDEFAKAYKKVEVYGCNGCEHLDDDIKCCECIAEQLKEKKE